ncbi:MAG: hypothetical protein CMJ46_10520 [Planctomyces sp.]|nr:hypothetical protein [Planctomyces sp.]
MNFKNILTKIKTADYKLFFVNHVEKFLVGFAALFVVYCLFATDWSFSQKDPAALEAKVATTKDNYTKTAWTAEERQKFEANTNLDNKIQQILYPIAVRKYGFSTDMDWPIFPELEPAIEPEFLAVKHLRAAPGRTLLELVDYNKLKQVQAAEQQLESTPADKLSEQEKQLMAQFGITAEQLQRIEEEKKRAEEAEKAGAAGARGRGGIQGPGGRGGARGISPYEQDENDRDSRRERRREMGDLVRQSSSVTEPHRFVSITGVFPVRQQKFELLKAMNSTSMAQAVMDIDQLFYDFKIQRQIAQPGNDPWAGEWQDVSRPVTEDILRRSAGFAPETVNQFVTNNIFTMPLPSRARGSWGRYATHPLIENYVLTEEEIQQQLEIVSAMVDKEVERIRAEEAAKENQRQGFSDFVYGMDQIANNPNESFLDKIAKETPDERERQIIEKLKEAATAQSNLQLFRFFDFSVEPGQIYRYRVKIIFRNPNYQKELYKVASPEIVEGEFRESEWSEPTLPVAVVDDLQYFVAREPVERQGRLVTSLEAYQWLEKFGTLVKSSLSVGLGDYVKKDSVRTEVVKPDESKIEKEDAKFESMDMLVAIEGPLELPPDIHPDLQIKNPAGRDIPNIPTLGLFATPSGILKVKDTIGETPVAKQMEDTVKFEQLTYSAPKTDLDAGGRRGDDDDDRDSRRDRSRGLNSNPTRRLGFGR